MELKLYFVPMRGRKRSAKDVHVLTLENVNMLPDLAKGN